MEEDERQIATTRQLHSVINICTVPCKASPLPTDFIENGRGRAKADKLYSCGRVGGGKGHSHSSLLDTDGRTEVSVCVAERIVVDEDE